MNEKISESKSLDMNNFVNIKKLKKFPIYFLQTFLKESRSLGGRGEGISKLESATKLFNRKLSPKLLN